jgi:dUTPase
MSINIKFKKLSPDAVAPKSNKGDVGFDLTSIEDVNIPSGRVVRIKTGIALAEVPVVIPRCWDENHKYMSYLIKEKQHEIYWEKYSQEISTHKYLIPFFKIEGRSGLASKGLFPVGGIIDPSYRGEIQVALFNSSDEVDYFKICKGDRIAQLVCYLTLANSNYLDMNFTEVDNLDETTRGDKGFGSSGA